MVILVSVKNAQKKMLQKITQIGASIILSMSEKETEEMSAKRNP